MTACPENSDIEVTEITGDHYDVIRKICAECGVNNFLKLTAGYSEIKKVAVLNGQPVGYAVMLYLLDDGEICTVCVAKEHRRKGIGSLLLESLVNEGKQLGIKIFNLEVRAENSPAITLYEKHGFTITGKRKNYYSNPIEDALVMSYYENTSI
ncbi:MAG: ribosomal protein S18-alanine N-acetyltransferase [Clostridia bacterium]|nr:ribosomal protein S18-alanine N-acetyltransferase [Clostridia bacterium]